MPLVAPAASGIFNGDTENDDVDLWRACGRVRWAGNRPAWHNYPASLCRRFAGAGGCNDWGARMNKRRVMRLKIGSLISREIAEHIVPYVLPTMDDIFRARHYRPIVGPRKHQRIAQWKNEQNRKGK